MKAIGSPLDFTGINLYTCSYVRPADTDLGYAVMPRPETAPKMASSWLYVTPEGLYWTPLLAAKVWNIREMYITENGASAADVMMPNGHVYDTDRVMYLRNYLTQLHRAVAAGAPVKGYFLWSLLDNYEWADGYDKRFGIHYVDFKTQQRTPKLSAEWYRAVIAGNRVA
jgi:beta-glucosidase